jgi:hypothetical protein
MRYARHARRSNASKWIAGAIAGLATFGIAFAFSKRTLRGVSVLHIGDSHVGGLRVPLERLIRASGGTYQAVFRNGISTERAFDLIDGLPINSYPDVSVVIVTLGTNDGGVLDGVAGDAIEAVYVSQLIDQIRIAAPRATIIWWGPPALLRPDVVDAPPLIAEAQRHGVDRQGETFVDSQEFIADGQDGIHFTSFGYGRWAEGNLRKTFWVRGE